MNLSQQKGWRQLAAAMGRESVNGDAAGQESAGMRRCVFTHLVICSPQW